MEDSNSGANKCPTNNFQLGRLFDLDWVCCLAEACVSGQCLSNDGSMTGLYNVDIFQALEEQTK